MEYMKGDTQWMEDVVEQADTMAHVVHEKLTNVKNTSTTNVQNESLEIVSQSRGRLKSPEREEVAEGIYSSNSKED